MPKNFKRSDRVADVVHRAIARLLRSEFKDPRVGMVTVSSVDVSPDLKQAKIFVTVMEEEKVTETLKVLNQAMGFFRCHLARDLNARIIPKPVFVYDGSVIRGNRISSLLEQCVRES